jgi:hypothetical protein
LRDRKRLKGTPEMIAQLEIDDIAAEIDSGFYRLRRYEILFSQSGAEADEIRNVAHSFFKVSTLAAVDQLEELKQSLSILSVLFRF